jgi:hypothetical protein
VKIDDIDASWSFPTHLPEGFETREEDEDLDRLKRGYLDSSRDTQESALRSGRKEQLRTARNKYSRPEGADASETVRWTLDEFWGTFDTIAGNAFESRYTFEEYLDDVHDTSRGKLRSGQRRLSEYGNLEAEA